MGRGWAGAAGLALALCGQICGCRAGGPRAGVVVSLTVPLLKFVQASGGLGGGKSPVVDFPLLEVFDGGGQLVYASHDAAASVALVKALPGALSRLQGLKDQPSLAEVIGSVPELSEEQKGALLRSHEPTVIAYSLEDCEACSVQEAGLGGETMQNLARQGMNSLEIRVARPH